MTGMDLEIMALRSVYCVDFMEGMVWALVGHSLPGIWSYTISIWREMEIKSGVFVMGIVGRFGKLGAPIA